MHNRPIRRLAVAVASAALASGALVAASGTASAAPASDQTAVVAQTDNPAQVRAGEAGDDGYGDDYYGRDRDRGNRRHHINVRHRGHISVSVHHFHHNFGRGFDGFGRGFGHGGKFGHGGFGHGGFGHGGFGGGRGFDGLFGWL